MAIRKFKPTTPGQRHKIIGAFENITTNVLLQSAEDIDALFRMTPYYYHTKPEDKAKLSGVEKLQVTLDFAVYCFRK